MARKRNPAPALLASDAVVTAPDEPAPDEPAPDEPAPDEPAPDEPAPDEPAPDEPAPPKVVDMAIRDLLQMLGRALPESAPLPPGLPPSLPEGMDADAKVADLTAGDLLRLLAAF